MFNSPISSIFMAFFITATSMFGKNTPPQYKAQNWVSIWAGTPVVLELAQSLDIRQLFVGAIVRFKVAENVVANGKTAIKMGAMAYGRVRQIDLCTDANDCRAFAIVAETATAVDGQNIHLSSVEQDFKVSTRTQKKIVYAAVPLNATVLNTQKINF